MPKLVMPSRAVLAAAAAVLAAALVGGGSPALAAGGTGGGCSGYGTGGGWWVTCDSGGHPGSSGGGGGGHQPCFWTTQSWYFPAGFKKYAPPAPKGYIYLVQVCHHGQYTHLPVLVANGGALSPQALAQRAWAELQPPLPTPQTAPPRGHPGLVGDPEWFWLPSGEWVTLTQRLAIGRVWAQVTAVPAGLTISPGASLPAVSCPGPGTPYTAGAQSSDCTYTYAQSSDGLPSSAYTVTVTVRWAATWRGSGGAGGALPALIRSASFPLAVAEGQGLNTWGGG